MTPDISYFNSNKDTVLLMGLKVKAGARENKIEGFVNIDAKQYLKLAIKTHPIENKANKAIIEFLAKEWKIAKSNLAIKTGLHSSLKVLEIKNIDTSYLKLILSPYIK